ncbi:MAG: flagellar basal body L-ring protein FlgH [Pseudomonadales bacterium]|nr:flagellar basal body L-ring protein FlgH [Pseudomonadales bacterium]MCP5331370.1 flagellar basal body L-ring protein FlgH [Pseudomonadales bacterium]MCP5344379.1 flagellar basal body L-ring protein FlgH [Pseudomonadales bacterium]
MKTGIPAIILTLPLLVACTATPSNYPEPNDPRYAPVMTPTPVTPVQQTGLIYTRNSAVDLYQRRAHRVGDVLTISLNEATTARKSSGTSFTKENATALGNNNVLGTGFMNSGLALNGDIASSVDFQGSGEADQSNQLVGSITVTVSNVLPNGLLEVRGEKWLQLNRGNEFIRISGLVRKEDIAPDNSILSTRVADVRIAYSGTGTLAESGEAGWVTKFFASEFWPF